MIAVGTDSDSDSILARPSAVASSQFEVAGGS